MSHPTSNRSSYDSNSRENTTQPAPPDKAQANLIKHNLERIGIVQTEKGENAVVRDYVYSTLWKNLKFVTSENELDFDGLLAKTVMREVNVKNDATIRQAFWARNRGKVLKWVNQKRNNTIGAVKKEFISKLSLSGKHI
jgi:hypothetical protein